jgi:prevent-host-death family protein
MISVPIYEAKTRLSELLVQAQHGEVITITRHGVPAGQIIGISGPGQGTAGARQQNVDAVFEALGRLRQGVTLDVTLDDAIRAGRAE